MACKPTLDLGIVKVNISGEHVFALGTGRLKIEGMIEVLGRA